MMKSCTSMIAIIARTTYPIEKEIFLFTGIAGTYANGTGTGTTEWPLPTSQREGKTPREQTYASPVPFVPQSIDKIFTCLIQWLSCSNENLSRLVGCLATAQKTRTVAEGHTRLWLRFRRVVGAVRRRSAPINPSFIHKTCGHSTGLRRER